MTDGVVIERRRQKIQEKITAGLLPASLGAEESTWIPTPYAVGRGPVTCHYCGEGIGADEALLIRDGEEMPSRMRRGVARSRDRRARRRGRVMV